MALAASFSASLPEVESALKAALVGFVGYGVSLVLFIYALRFVGTARTGAYFSTAPFIGAAFSLILLGESVGVGFYAGAAFMAVGVYLHLTERHEHEHRHEPLEHEHSHYHDEHHQHPHTPGEIVTEPHSHLIRVAEIDGVSNEGVIEMFNRSSTVTRQVLVPNPRFS